MERDCQYNKAIVCDSHECYHCGWDPEVAKKRSEELMKTVTEPKPYKVSFAGHYEVWAKSPEEAIDKARNGDMCFSRYEFGVPECLEKEEADELDRPSP